MAKEKQEKMIQVMQLRPPKLKDNPRNRSRIVINLKEDFGFIPELLFIDKDLGENNKIIISAVMPREMIEAEEKESKKSSSSRKKKDEK